MLGFLTNLRDIKSSLVSGMILLFTFWLVFGNAFMKVPNDDSVTGNLTRTASYLGTPGTLAVLVFIAYVVGMVASTHAWLDVVEGFKGGKVANSVSKSTAERFAKFLGDLVDGVQKYVTAVDLIAVLKLEGADFDRIKHYKDADSQKREMKKRLTAYLENYVLTDLKVLAAQLHTAHDKAWEKYEKAASEANFRASMVIPLALMTIALSWRIASEGNIGLMFVVIAVMLAIQVVLVLKAASKRHEANEEIIHAIVNENIDVPPITTVKALGGK
jgi:hypothetical protein